MIQPLPTVCVLLRSVTVLLLVGGVLCAPVLPGVDEPTVIGVIAAERGGINDLGFEVDTVENAPAMHARLQAAHPQAKHYSHCDNVRKDRMLGHHVVVIEADYDHDGVRRHAISIGFGTGTEAARQDAERLLGRRHVWIPNAAARTVLMDRAW